MAVFELRSPVKPTAVEPLAELLAEREEQQLMVAEDKPSARAWVVGYFDSRESAESVWSGFRASCTPGLVEDEVSIKELPDTDWKESYKIHFKAWKFGELNWVPVWEWETFKLPAGEQVLWLDPGMAFGTGNHETTRLVVERLVDYKNRKGASGRVIDAGCGSGILALSAAKLGFREMAAFDNDPVAVQVSEANADRNELAGAVEFFVGDLVTGLQGREAELVLANIQADVLIRHARELVAAVAPAGELVLSGILAEESSRVATAFARIVPSWPTDSREMGEWCDRVLRRP